MFRYYCLLHLCLFMQSIFACPRKRSLPYRAKGLCVIRQRGLAYSMTGRSSSPPPEGVPTTMVVLTLRGSFNNCALWLY